MFCIRRKPDGLAYTLKLRLAPYGSRGSREAPMFGTRRKLVTYRNVMRRGKTTGCVCIYRLTTQGVHTNKKEVMALSPGLICTKRKTQP